MTKSVAYSAELVSAIVEKYTTGVAIEEIAKEVGKTVPMIRSKLVSEGVYKAKAKISNGTGAVAVRKIALARQIASKFDIESLDSLEKASKADLEALLTAITEMVGE